MAKINFSAVNKAARPTYTVDKVGNREVLCNVSTGGQKSFTKSWLMELGAKGDIEMDAELTPEGAIVWQGAVIKFTGTIEREF